MIEKIQIKYDGHFHEIPAAELDINPHTATDSQVKQAVASHLGADSLREYIVQPDDQHVDRSSVTVLNLRPEAVFG